MSLPLYNKYILIINVILKTHHVTHLRGGMGGQALAKGLDTTGLKPGRPRSDPISLSPSPSPSPYSSPSPAFSLSLWLFLSLLKTIP